MSLILQPKNAGRISVVQDPTKFNWAGIPYHQRYENVEVEKDLLRQMHNIDPWLDIKRYKPTGKIRVVRYGGDLTIQRALFVYGSWLTALTLV